MMNMPSSLVSGLLLAAIWIGIAESAVAIFPTKSKNYHVITRIHINKFHIGETLILDLGKDVKEWKRMRDGQEETIKYCADEKGKDCNVWLNADHKTVGDGREHIFDNGTLIIENFQTSDSGDYYTDDELQRIHYTADGHVWQLARTKISVVPI
ncbi:unnamed protein product [Caenorhabditis bovis]|uniref:Uncharacterized protein n=1 Tax=Caenorhabditis bovis TaxID=2654633 RepID=A0A8S1EIC8_9PELO|nr:unnamed protein product [Caenorhabditis bovis]